MFSANINNLAEKLLGVKEGSIEVGIDVVYDEESNMSLVFRKALTNGTGVRIEVAKAEESGEKEEKTPVNENIPVNASFAGSYCADGTRSADVTGRFLCSGEIELESSRSNMLKISGMKNSYVEVILNLNGKCQSSGRTVITSDDFELDLNNLLFSADEKYSGSYKVMLNFSNECSIEGYDQYGVRITDSLLQAARKEPEKYIYNYYIK